MKRILSLLTALLLLVSLLGCTGLNEPVRTPKPQSEIDAPVFTLEPAAAPTPEPTELPTSEPAKPEPAAIPTPAPTEPATPEPTELPTPEPTDTPCPVSEDGEYWSKDSVALYIHLFGHLPKNYVTKSKAKSLGWPGYGSVDPYAPGCSIGGDYYGNYEGLLPSKKGRKYTECDIDTHGKTSRGARRIVFSNDGLIYYTDDHYESFTLLYGEE